MAYLIETPNAFEPLKSTKTILEEPVSIREWVRRRHPDTGDFPVPTICILNGEAVLRKDWDTMVEKDDIVNFITMPAGLEALLIIAIVVVVITIGVSLIMMLNAPKTPGAAAASDPVFTTKGQQNEIRAGEPIEVCYGRNRLYPAYASRPYFQYLNNDEFQYDLFCLGQGEYDIEAIQIGDTAITNYQEITYEIIPPNGTVTLFPSAVYTAPEAGGQECIAPNDPLYVPPGWVGPFVAVPTGQKATQIQVDVQFPKGLYLQNGDGSMQYIIISFEIEIQSIDDLGNPTGAWTHLIPATPIITVTGATFTPQRRSYVGTVTPDRYQMRIRRTTGKGLTANYGNDLILDGLSSFLQISQQTFGDVTLMAVKMRATNNLNSQSQQKFNVICTRKLPIRESGGTWSAPQITRSIIWALVDVFKANYGGRIDDEFFDWDALDALDSLYASRGDNFDWIFRDPITVWQAAQAIALVGRGVPILSGSQLTMIRNGPLTIPVAMFNQENILGGTIEWDITLWDPGDYDCVQIEYTDPTTGYTQQTVNCTLPGGTADNPQQVQLPGCQDRTHAYHEGLFMRAQQVYLRENFVFETGLEGNIPTFGDLIALSHDVPRWGQGGYVVNGVRGVSNTYQLWVSEPLKFEEGQSVILLKGRATELLGPFNAYPTTDPKQVYIQCDEDLDFLNDGTTEPMLFQFGVGGKTAKYLRVVMIEPTASESVKITGVVDNPIIHSFDNTIAPPLGEPAYPPSVPDLPIVQSLQATQINASLYIVQVAWLASFGAQYYIVQTSNDNVFWTQQATTVWTSLQFQTVPGTLYIRVAAVNLGQGPWSEVTLGVAHIVALTLTQPWTDLSWAVSWFSVLGAESYTVSIFDAIPSTPVLKRTYSTTSLQAAYNYALAITDSNLVREMIISVLPVFPPPDAGVIPPVITPTQLEVTNSIPEPPLHPGSIIHAVESSDIVHRLFWDVAMEGDLIRLKVWLSAVSGFDPHVLSPTVDETISSPGWAGIPTHVDLPIPLDSTGAHPHYYWRAAIFDVWGNELTTNITAEQIIPAYP